MYQGFNDVPPFEVQFSCAPSSQRTVSWSLMGAYREVRRNSGEVESELAERSDNTGGSSSETKTRPAK